MKTIKKVLLSLTLLTTLQATAHGDGWGGFGAGLFTGVAATSIATAASRSGEPKPDAYYDMKDRENQRRSTQKEIERKGKDKREHERALDKIDRNKKLTSKERDEKKAEHISAIKEIEDDIKDLRKELRRI